MSRASRPISTAVPHLAAEGVRERREVLALAVAAGDQHQRAGHPATAASVAPTLVPFESLT